MTPRMLGMAPHTEAADRLVVRPIGPEDKPALVDGFDRLSQASRYRRFLSPHPRLTASELRYFTEVDHHDHEALVAIDPDTQEGVGVARFVRSSSDPAEAEFAVAVVDDWQGCGVGSRLAEALARRARQEGISRFTGLVLAGNEPMLNLAAELGEVQILHRDHETIELVLTLPERGLGGVAGVLRATAAGYLNALPLHRERPRTQVN